MGQTLCGSSDDVRGEKGRHMHDHPIAGHFTAFFADSFNGAFGFGKMTDEEIKAAFDKIDTKHQGFLDKCEITEALRHHGMSEREVQKFIDNMEEDALDFEEFSALCKGKAQAYITTYNVGGVDVHVPNLAKVHDIPVLGAFTGASHDLTKNVAFGFAGVAMGAAWGGLTDEQLKAKFEELDTEKLGKLDGKELAAALRGLKMNEVDIKAIKAQVGEKGVDFHDFKALIRHKTGSTSIHDHPVTGHFTQFFADSFSGAFGFGAMTDAEIEAAFNKIDSKHQGYLDKWEIHHALQEHGKSEREIQRFLDNMEEEKLDFEEFKALCKGKAQSYVTSVEIAGYDLTMPNLAKVHDIPILGAFTQATHHMVSGMTKQSYGLMGTAFAAAFGNLDDEHLKMKFDEIDTEKIGKLNKREVAAALRNLGLNEVDIKGITAAMGDDLIDFEGFKKLAGH
mmetsp:Transcript_6099/g.11675  ORF Transcript_6099/g.11675 Transcript_6099/m.11675 type:complete len:451 (+) Transcript_6099:75-1427(+)